MSLPNSVNTSSGFSKDQTLIHKKLDQIRRKTSQALLPMRLQTDNQDEAGYNMYPVFSLPNNKICNGFDSLAEWIILNRTIIIDGYVGVFWNQIKSTIQEKITSRGFTVNWIETESFLKTSTEIDFLLQPFLGKADSVWGTKCLLELKDFYKLEEFVLQLPDSNSAINIVIGSGSTLIAWDVPVIYIDLPKNEVQYRMRAGAIANLGSDEASESFSMYKRFYFVDWVLLNRHKKEILDKIAVIADGQWIDDINWILKEDFTEALNKISQSIIRVRPWFEPGVWGGQWMNHHIPRINRSEINYAWSFELIAPENGLILESDGYLLEASFDFIMFQNQKQVLGKHVDRFGDEFPIRFDFLDTYNGGNLSIQCHPGVKYIQDTFGEKITQDECYYILDCKEEALVYLGFQDSINPDAFKKELTRSLNDNVEVRVEDFVQSHAAQKHNLFLIPNGTIHSAGADNLVLEISATPYIYTFKLYDWLRFDMDGIPRPINIEHAFRNLDFERKGNRVEAELISKPRIKDQGIDWKVVHLPTHAEHYYDVHRLEFDKQIEVNNNDGCHVMMLVEGESILVETANGTRQQFAYAETFIIPAAAVRYKLTNLGKGQVKVIKAFLK